MKLKLLLAAFVFVASQHFIIAQAVSKSNSETKPVTSVVPNTLSTDLLSGFKFRSIGPALMSGRIADIAIHPKKPSSWYIAVGSGGVWKTDNAGNTFTPIFDSYGSFSIGCVTIDPMVNSTVWVGTGENVGGRHVGIGDGIYKSNDDGKTFTNMGLKQSEHISKIIVHPSNSNIVWVAAQGPLWSKGGERGIFKTTDGGKTWKQTLGDKEWVGATEIQIDPRNANVLYAATWQRHRTVAAYLGGGPGTALHKSTDGGETWTKMTNGLPTSNMGKIGLAISPQKPDVIYASIELDRRTGGIYKSENGGITWNKMSDVVSGATGPHYYQELYASPHQFDKLYLMDVRVQISNDGGKSFSRMKEEYKHSDNHAIAFLADRPDYLLVGTDGGLYESFDNAENWKFFANLPVTQFYDVAIDDSKPFYKVYGGTQDNSTQGGPSRTDKIQGIMNSDWSVVLDWDGQQPATEPGNPNIIYGQRQEGTLSRIDMKTGEVTDIQPSPAEGESFERFNWDAPILVSPHDPKQLFFGSQRVWRSMNRGDEWVAISGDLTRNQTRLNLPIMGSTQSYDNAWDVNAMSNYNTITMIGESPKQKDLIYVGTDDGLIQITEDGGKTWRKVEVSTLPGCPATAYVNELKADLFDVNIVYATLDNHKYGDFNPYVYKSIDKGKTWKSIKSNLPERNYVWRLMQDHINPKLIFAGTEFGLYVTINGGESWSKMSGDLPLISIRDIAIQKEHDDLVLATFGRGFYILDDIAPLRNLNDEAVGKEVGLFDIKDADWYVPRSHLGFENAKEGQGANFYAAPNPAFGASISYYLKDDIKSLKEQRKEKEKKAIEAKIANTMTTWEDIAKEENEVAPKIIVSIYDEAGNIVRKLDGPAKKGINTVTWDLKNKSIEPIGLSGGMNAMAGLLLPPGKYTASISKEVGGVITSFTDKKSFTVKPLYENTLKQMNSSEVTNFFRSFEKASASSSKLMLDLDKTSKYAKAIKTALHTSALLGNDEVKTISEVTSALFNINTLLSGDSNKGQMGEKNNPTISSRLFDIMRGIGGATYGPTKTNIQSLVIINKQLGEVTKGLEENKSKLKAIADKIMKAGGAEVDY
jgi:photosystem II stability/assembly factor-like uncharacterized protein